MSKISKLINEYRVFPRITLIFMLWVTIYSFNWFTSIPKPTTEQSAVVIALTGATVGFSVKYLNKKPNDNQE